jgi:CDP-glucose 4,6-dehydratase
MDKFWLNKKVFITGHTGFKGSWLSLWLQELGADVTGYALPPPTNPSLFELASVNKGMRSLEGDIRDFASLDRALKSATPEVVLHLAAQPLVRESYRSPLETYATNVMGTAHLLEAIRTTPSVRSTVIVTTDKCYENREWAWGYRENEAMGGHDPYSSSKGCVELVTSAYRKSFFGASDSARIASARAGNVIGGGDFAADRLIPDIVRAITENKTLEIRNPESTRPWQHVLEPLSGYLKLAEVLFADDGARYADGWNFGPLDKDAWSVRDVVNEFLSRGAFKGMPMKMNQEPSGPHEATWLKLDISKAKHFLGWEPRLQLKEGLAWTAEWYEAWRKKADMRAMTLAQIKNIAGF